MQAAICNIRAFLLAFWHVSQIKTNGTLANNAWACKRPVGLANLSKICQCQQFMKGDVDAICYFVCLYLICRLCEIPILFSLLHFNHCATCRLTICTAHFRSAERLGCCQKFTFTCQLLNDTKPPHHYHLTPCVDTMYFSIRKCCLE